MDGDPLDPTRIVAEALHAHGYGEDDPVPEEADPEHYEQAADVVLALQRHGQLLPELASRAIAQRLSLTVEVIPEAVGMRAPAVVAITLNDVEGGVVRSVDTNASDDTAADVLATALDQLASWLDDVEQDADDDRSAGGT